ncbi:MAG: DUF5610 domain-containing protein [Magnetococcales bacterium]|nr:DUF5610 domain-containing protein [Magnetococcales bacterium]
MMIQQIGVLQSYNALANSGAKVTNKGGSGALTKQPPVESDVDIEPESRVRESDSINFSVAGAGAYANQVLRDNTIAKLNGLMQELDGNAKPVEELDPAEHTPEKTAEYIVSMSTSFYEIYSQGHPDLENQEALDGFVELISGGIKKGLEEAKELLEGLNVLNGLIEEGIDSTDSLIWEKMNTFYEDKLASFAVDDEQKLAIAA